jgi:hypothetical protein
MVQQFAILKAHASIAVDFETNEKKKELVPFSEAQKP